MSLLKPELRLEGHCMMLFQEDYRKPSLIQEHDLKISKLSTEYSFDRGRPSRSQLISLDCPIVVSLFMFQLDLIITERVD